MDSNVRKNSETLQDATETERTYIFEMREDIDKCDNVRSKMRTAIWQIFPSVCASLAGIPFGMMLGWPSPNYPTLLQPDSPVPINLDQSAMVAGFLMLGLSFGTIFSTVQIGPGPKYGIILGNILILTGWILMWQSQNVYWFLGSRFALGTGYGYGLGQIRFYIREMTEDELSNILLKHISLHGFVGVVIGYVIGSVVEFRQYSIISIITAVFVLFLAVFLPCSPRELIRAERINDAKKLLSFLKPNLDPQQETYKIIHKMSQTNKTNPIHDMFFNKTLRINFIKFTIILFCQQYSGSPPMLVYTQIIFTESHIPYPEFFAIGYAVLFLMANFFGIYYFPSFNKKITLLLSSYGTLLLYVCKILVIYYNVNENYFTYTTVVIMYLFIIVHTVGLGSIPYTFINDWFPDNCKPFLTKYFIILHSLFALTVTKLFQVLLGQFIFYIPFCFLSGITIFAIVFIHIFISVGKDSFELGS